MIPKKCEDWGPEYKCSRIEHCDKNSFAAKEQENVITGFQADDLFFPRSDDLFVQNGKDSLVVNTEVSPCENPLAICCIPNEPKCPDGTPLPTSGKCIVSTICFILIQIRAPKTAA